MARTSLILLPLLLALLAGQAVAAPPEWEELILDGVRRQDSRLREVSPDAVVRDAELAAARPSAGAVKVARLYLLGRAYGKRADLSPPEQAVRDWGNARRVLQEAVALEPACYFAHRDLGILALRSTPPDFKGAEAALQRALGANPNYVQALRDLARLCSDQGRSADTLVHLKRVIDLEPADMPARALLVMSLIDLKRVEEARREVQALLSRKPKDPMLRDLLAEVELASGNYDAAISLWLQLQDENPSATKPLWGQWRAWMAKGKAGQPVAKPKLRDVVDRLSMLERDPAKRTKLRELGDSLRAPEPDPNQPPDDAAIQRALAGPDAELRTKAVMYVAFRQEKPSNPVLRAVMARLDWGREPVPAVRAGALVALMRQGGFGLLGLVRHSLGDPDANVRGTALQAVETLGEPTDASRRAAFLILGTFASSADPLLAAGSRAATWRLAEIPQFEGELDADSERTAWQAWWNGPIGVDLKLRALHVYAQIRDLQADQVLVPFLDDPDLFVVEAATQALRASAPALQFPEVKEWVGRLPNWVDGFFTPEHRQEIAQGLATWRAMRPATR